MRLIQKALTFDDVLLVPAYSDVLPRDTQLQTNLTRNLRLNIPMVSACMDTVTESRLAIALAQEGGVGFIHKNMSADQQAAEVSKVKRHEAGVVSEPITIGPDMLVGDVIAIARDYLDCKPVHAHDGTVIESKGDLSDTDCIRRYGVAYLRNEQDDDLDALGVHFDNFYLESSLYASGRVQAAVQSMIDSGRTEERDGALWLKTTECEDLGIHDDKNRVMRKVDGTFTYFVPDVAYHLAKFERGFTKAVNIQGSDHHGTIARVRCGLQCCALARQMSIPKEFPEYILHKMLSVVKDGEPVKMSKRSGNYVTLRDLVDMAGQDAARFFLVARKADAEFVFDINLAQQKSDENPVYYLQYAHARICSVFANAKEKGYEVPSADELIKADLSSLVSEQAMDLMAKIAEYPSLLTLAAKDHAPHMLCYYLKELAAAFHTFYNAERVVIENDVERNARLALLAATRQVLGNGLALLGISAPEYMARREDA